MKTYTITQENLDALVEMGANRWTKGDYDRLYLSECGNKIIGLDVSYYKTGSISSAELNGEKISNAEARRIMSVYKDAYINLKTGGIGGLKGEDEYHDLFLEKINAFRTSNEG